MLTTLAVLMGLSGVAPVAAAGAGEVDVALVLAVDTSRSMDFEEIGIQRQGYVEALKHKEFIDAVKGGLTGRIAISYFEWAGYVVQDSVIDWQVIETEAERLATRAFDSALSEMVESGEPEALELAAANRRRTLFEMTRGAYDELRSHGDPRPGLPELPPPDTAAARTARRWRSRLITGRQ